MSERNRKFYRSTPVGGFESAIFSREVVFDRVSRQHFCRFLTHSETEGRQEQRSKCNHTAAPHHMVECHLRSTIDPALEMGDVYGVQNKESPGAKGSEQSNQGVAPPL